jgi:hypothetical protein
MALLVDQFNRDRMVWWKQLLMIEGQLHGPREQVS